MPRNSAATTWNRLVDDSVGIRRNVIHDGYTEIDAMVSRWRRARIGVMHTIASMTLRVQSIRETPFDELPSRLVFQMRRPAVFNGSNFCLGKIDDPNVHSNVSFRWNLGPCLEDARELVSVPGQPGNTAHSVIVQDQQHECIIGYFPLARDSMAACGLEPESRVKVGVTENNDKRKTQLLDFQISRFDQFAANTLPLVMRNHCHGTQGSARNLARHSYRAVHDMADYPAIKRRDQRKQCGSVRPQCIDNVPFLVLSECALVHLTNRRDIVRTLFSNLNHK
jgi:hypothetical protein